MAETPALTLYLSDAEAWNSSFCLEDGMVLYKSISPFTLFGRKIDLLKAIPAPPDDPEEGLRGVFTHMAQINVNHMGRAVFKYRGMEVPDTEMFRKEGWDWEGRNRVFKDPGGIEYAWRLCTSKSKLVLHHSPKVVVANFHRKRHGIFHERRSASLEIYPPGRHIVDLIVMTYIYVERIRTQQEDAERRKIAF